MWEGDKEKEHLFEKVGAPVDHLGLLRDEPNQLDDTLHSVQVADLCLERGQEVESNEFGGIHSLRHLEICEAHEKTH